MTQRPFPLFAGLLASLVCLWLIWSGHLISAVLWTYVSFLGITWASRLAGRRAWLAQLQSERAGEDFQSFLSALNRPGLNTSGLDPRRVRLTYVALASMAGFDAAGIALRPDDDLRRDLRLRQDDLGQALWDGLKGPLALGEAELGSAPGLEAVRTVADLLDCLALASGQGV